MTTTEAKTKLEAAERALEQARENETERTQELAGLAVCYGDEPDSVSAAAYFHGRDAAELAGLVTRAETRRLDQARVDLDTAERNEARSTIERCLPLTDRAGLFDRAESAIADLAETLTPHRVPSPEMAQDELDEVLDEQASRARIEAKSRHAIHGLVLEQHAACDSVRAASVRLGESCAVEHVLEAHLLGLAELDSGPITIDRAHEIVSRALGLKAGYLTLPSELSASLIGYGIDRSNLSWARPALMLGSMRAALDDIRRALETPEDREQHARNVAASAMQREEFVQNLNNAQQRAHAS